MHVRPAPSVSVIIPVHNEERWIGRALRSMQSQTFRDFEVVVVDDGSTDATAAVIHAARRSDDRIRYVENEGVGFVAAQNTGISRSGGDLIARLDADDASLPRRLELQVREMEANPAAVALGTYGWRVNEWGLRVGRLRTGPAGREGYRAMIKRGQSVQLTHSSAMFRRQAAERVGGYRLDFYPTDDFHLWNSLLDHGEVYALPSSLTLYTLRMTSMSASQAELMVWQVVRARAAVDGQSGSPDDHMELTPEQRRWASRATARRRLVRALANGRLIEGARAMHEHGVRWPELRRQLARAVRG